MIALARGEARSRAVLAAAWEASAGVSIPAVVLAETIRGAHRDAPVNRIVKAVGAVDVADEDVGRTAGSLIGAAGSGAAADALIVATAVHAGGGVILTGDVADLSLLAAGHPGVSVQPL